MGATPIRRILRRVSRKLCTLTRDEAEGYQSHVKRTELRRAAGSHEQAADGATAQVEHGAGDSAPPLGRGDGDIDAAGRRSAITRASPEDIDQLNKTFGTSWLYEDRYRRQQAGEGVLFVSRINGRPVGHGFLWLAEAEEPEIRAGLPGVPLITNLAVAAEHRGNAIGTQLVSMIEHHARIHGRDRIALAVFPSNPATRLYTKLGYYKDLGIGPVQCYNREQLADGTFLSVPDPEMADVMVKNLASARGKLSGDADPE